jgi:molecular chaperone DnaJ
MGTDSTDDPYALLGIEADSDSVTVRSAWRRLALEWHPDRAGPEAKPTFQRILAAYTLLSDPLARAAYDRQRGRARHSPAPPPSSATRRQAPSVTLWRLSGQLATLLASGVARRAEQDVIELFLDAREASEGGIVTISMRVPIRCPDCADEAAGPCERCGATRAVEEMFSAWMTVTPDVAEGTVLTPSVLLPGMLRPVSFRVRLRGAT